MCILQLYGFAEYILSCWSHDFPPFWLSRKNSLCNHKNATEEKTRYTANSGWKTWLPCHDHTMMIVSHGHDHDMMMTWRLCFLAWCSWFMAWSSCHYHVAHDSYHHHGMIIMFSMFFLNGLFVNFSQMVASVYHFMAKLTDFGGDYSSNCRISKIERRLLQK